jgi:hypothetical protein
MTYPLFIYDNPDGRQVVTDITLAVPDAVTVLYEGTEEHLKTLGFTKEHEGGFVLLNGKLTFDKAKYEAHKEATRPLAMGRELIKVLGSMVAFLPPSKHTSTIRAFGDIIRTLESDFNNPLSKVNADAYLAEVKTLLVSSGVNGDLAKIMGKVNEYLTTHRLV